MTNKKDLEKLVKKTKRRLETKGRNRTYSDIKNNTNLNMVSESQLNAAVLAKTSKTEQTIVEKVLNERNMSIGDRLPDGIDPAEVLKASENGQYLPGAASPKTEIQRRIIAEADAAMEETLNLSAYIPNESVLAFVKNSNIPKSELENMLRAKPWTVFQVNGEGLMKTPDNKLETVKNYCYRLERAVIDVSRVKNDEIDRLRKALYEDGLKVVQLSNDLTKAKMALKRSENLLIEATNRLRNVPMISIQETLKNTLLLVKTAFDKLKSLILNSLTEEPQNGQKEKSETTSN